MKNNLIEVTELELDSIFAGDKVDKALAIASLILAIISIFLEYVSFSIILTID